VVVRERIILEQVLDELRTNRELSRVNWQWLYNSFKERFTKAWKLVTENRIKKYLFKPSGKEVWIAVGQLGEYMIYPLAEYCGCNDFYFRVLDGETPLCYHLLAQKIAEALDHYEKILEDDEAYTQLIEIWKKEIAED
jgi:predicted nucleic acid-binding Zn finger protein